MIFIVVKFAVRPEVTDDWLHRVDAFTQATRSEPGNLWFEWSHSVDDPNQFLLVEAFRDTDAGKEHVGSEHFKTATQELPQLLASTPEVINVEVPGTRWSELGEMSVTAPGGG
ncbi:MAG: antibiotic biosynthesis monooxygenase [Actinomycetota bacterium]|nr:antibiotic biosynthesis monooxygenase [Actinomycetota bacterium]